MFKLSTVFSYSMEIRLSVSGCMHWSAGRGREGWMCARISEEGVPGGVQWRVLQRRSSDARYGNDVIICEWEVAGLVVEFEFLGFLSPLVFSFSHTVAAWASFVRQLEKEPFSRASGECWLFIVLIIMHNTFSFIKKREKKGSSVQTKHQNYLVLINDSVWLWGCLQSLCNSSLFQWLLLVSAAAA